MFSKLFLIIFVSAGFVFPQNSNSLLNKVKNYHQSETLKHGQLSFTAKYVDDGKTIISYNGGQSITPASNLKLFTTAAALEILGENYTYETKIFYSGKIDNSGILNGDIIIIGGGDPTLGSDNFENYISTDSLLKMVVKEISNKGIKQITGAVVADNSRYDRISIPDKWYWEDIGNYYAAQTSGLSINDNYYKIFFKPGYSVGDYAEFLRIEPEVPGLDFYNNMKTGARGSGDNGYVYNSPGNYYAELRGTIPQGYKEFFIKGALPDPALLAVQLLDKYLQESGIKTDGRPEPLDEKINVDESKLITRITSPPLKEIVKIVNKKSFNFYAEMLLKELGYRVLGEGSYEKGIQSIKEFLEEKEIDTGGFKIYDGSGLSRSNVVTTDMTTELLLKMKKSKSYNAFFSSLAVAGNSKDIGTLKSFGKDTILENNVFAKSGFITGVRGYSGYLKTQSGKLVAFSIIANNYNIKINKTAEILKQILIELASSN